MAAFIKIYFKKCPRQYYDIRFWMVCSFSLDIVMRQVREQTFAQSRAIMRIVLFDNGIQLE